jgi:SAM-dependent methyltransferase
LRRRPAPISTTSLADTSQRPLDIIKSTTMEQTAKSAQTNPPGLAETFRGHAPDQQGGRWIELWDANNTPWDRGQPHPGLEDLLVEKQDSIGQSWTVDPAAGKRRKRALVPGCGRGYDCLLLSAFGYDVYGLDISETGLKAAKAYEEAHKDDEVYQPRHENGRGKVTWMLADFFKDDFLEKIGGDRVFDLLYDYTVRLHCSWSNSY